MRLRANAGPKMSQALELINSSRIEKKLRDGHSRLSAHFDNVPARVAAAGKPPTDGLVAWFKADTGVLTAKGDAPLDGGLVARWNNFADKTVKKKSESNLDGTESHPTDAMQNNVGLQPTFVENSIGGLPAILFDGKDDYLHNIQSKLLATGSPRTLIIVGRLADTTGGALFTFGRARQNGSSVFTAQHVAVGGTYYVYSDGVVSSGNTTAPLEQLSDLNQPFVTTFISAGSGNKLRVRVNGTDLPTTQAGSVGLDQGEPGFTIGSREDIPLGQQIWNGDISEILVYDRALSDEHLGAAGRYAATKYNLTTSYPRAKFKFDAKVSDQEIVTDLYFAAYCRPPSETELNVATNHIESSPDRRRALEDIAWALMNSKEFLFQH